MQKSRAYSGTIEVGTAVQRTFSFGMENKMGIDNRTDFFNQTVADFLHDDCGVDAAYEVRAGSEDKYLWIYGMPFLFVHTYNSTSKLYGFNFYEPLNADTRIQGGVAHAATYQNQFTTMFNGNTGQYSFTLYFTGNAKNCFALRWKGYNATTISIQVALMFFRAKNILNEKNAVIWRSNAFSHTNGMITLQAMDINGDKSPDLESYTTPKMNNNGYLIYANLIANTTKKTYEKNPNKLPLIPITAANYLLQGIYQFPINFHLPAVQSGMADLQTEFEAGGRRLINTCSGDRNGDTAMMLSYGYLDMGLIDVTDE